MDHRSCERIVHSQFLAAVRVKSTVASRAPVLRMEKTIAAMSARDASMLDLDGMSAQTLGIGDTSQRQILRIGEVLFDFTVEQTQLNEQRRVPVRRKSLDEVFDHRPQPPCNLQIVRTTGTDLAECEVHKVLPIWSPENHTKLPGFVESFVGAQMTVADHSQHAVELVYREYRGRRIINR